VSYVPATVGQGARTLEGSAYASEEVFRQEQERIFGEGWVCVGRSEALSEPGDYLTIDVGAENLLLVRDEDGIRAFFNFCRHRGARLVTDECGTADCFRCPYHGWSYALNGRLTAARHMREVPGFRLDDYPLVPAGLREWEGFLWISLSEEPEPFEQAFAPVLTRFQRWHIGELKLAQRVEYDVRANWKLIVENYSECYHCNLIHPELVAFSPAESGRNDLTEGAFLGGYMDLNDRCDSMTLSGKSTRPPIGEVDGEDLSRVYYYALFPNLLLSLHPDYVMAHLLRPESAACTHITCEFYFAPETIARPDFDAGDAVDFWDRVTRQDWAINERVQLGIGSKAYTSGPYANQEGLLWAFDREYLRRMGYSATSSRSASQHGHPSND
jgi:glycine betaine catabolism A